MDNGQTLGRPRKQVTNQGYRIKVRIRAAGSDRRPGQEDAGHARGNRRAESLGQSETTSRRPL